MIKNLSMNKIDFKRLGKSCREKFFKKVEYEPDSFEWTEFKLPTLYLIITTLITLTLIIVKPVQNKMTQNWLTQKSNETNTPINLINDSERSMVTDTGYCFSSKDG